MKHKKYSTNHLPRRQAGKLQTTNYGGFSFIEVMLAVFLVSVGITTTIALITLGIRKSTESRRQLVAVMLSQEGIEMVRNIRDTDAKAGGSFDSMSLGNYTIDYTNPIFGSESGPLNDVSGFYKYGSGGTPSQFFRRILISGNSDSRTVYSTVVWGNAAIPNTGALIESSCNLATRCTYTKITLNKWRE